MVHYPAAIRIVDVGPRDGLQNEAYPVSVQDRLTLIRRLQAANLPSIEIGAMVSPKWVPQMAGSVDVIAAMKADMAGCDLSVLVPNQRGMQDALAAGANSVAVFVAASEGFSQKNTNASIAQSLERVAEVATLAKASNIRLRGYVSCIVACPFDGPIAPEQVVSVTRSLLELGCHEISLGDTTGIATPGDIRKLMDIMRMALPDAPLAAHFHDTWGQALANLVVALDYGISSIDASVAGLGGCPYAPGAGGNVATEDVVYMLHGMGIDTGIDFTALVETGAWISNILGREYSARAGRAWRQKRENCASGQTGSRD